MFAMNHVRAVVILGLWFVLGLGFVGLGLGFGMYVLICCILP